MESESAVRLFEETDHRVHITRDGSEAAGSLQGNRGTRNEQVSELSKNEGTEDKFCATFDKVRGLLFTMK